MKKYSFASGSRLAGRSDIWSKALLVVMVASVAGCGKKEPDQSGSPASQQAAIAPAAQNTNNPQNVIPPQGQAAVPVPAGRRSSAAPKELAKEFIAAVGAGKVKEVKSLLDQGVDVDAVPGKYVPTPLQQAIYDGHKDVVRLLLSRGARVTGQFIMMEPPLHEAAERYGVDIVQLIVEKGADVKSLTVPEGRTVLQYAARRGDRQVMEYLLSVGADLHAKAKDDGRTALHVAAAYGRTGAAELLIAKGADVNAPDKWGRTPMSQAADRGHKDIIAILKAHGGKE